MPFVPECSRRKPLVLVRGCFLLRLVGCGWGQGVVATGVAVEVLVSVGSDERYVPFDRS